MCSDDVGMRFSLHFELNGMESGTISANTSYQPLPASRGLVRSCLGALMVCWLAQVFPGLGDGRFEITNWQIEDGLPENTVLDVARTPDGFLWIAGTGGLARFDGKAMKVFDRSLSEDLPADRVSRLAVGRSGRLWLVAGEALLWLEAGAFRKVADLPDLSDPNFGGLAEDRSGNLVVLVSAGTVMRVSSTGTVSELPLPAEFDAGELTHIIGDAEGEVWISNGRKLWRIEEDRLALIGTLEDTITGLLAGRDGRLNCRLADGDMVELVNGRIRGRRLAGGLRATPRLVDRLGNLWMLDDQLWVEQRGRVRELLLLESNRVITIHALVADGDGNVWVGTENHGLFRIVPRAIRTIVSPDGDSHVVSLKSTHDGFLWLATESGKFAGIKDDNWLPWTVFTKHRALLYSSRNENYYGLDGLGLSRLIKRTSSTTLVGSSVTNITALFEDRSGRIWMGTRAEGVELFADEQFISLETASGLNDTTVTSFAQGTNGAVWIGAQNGLYRAAGEEVRRFSEEDGYAGGGVRTLLRDRRGTIWIGTEGQGLVRWRDGSFASIDSSQGLFDDTVSQILDDDRGFLWLGGNRGVSRVAVAEVNQVLDAGSGKIAGRQFQAADGMRNAQCSSGAFPSCLKTGDGQLWFSTVDGVVNIDPYSVLEEPAPPPVHITGLKIDGEAWRPDDSATDILGSGIPQQTNQVVRKIRIPAGSRRVEIDYAGISLQAGAPIKYRTRLIGFDQEWNDMAERRVATFTGLRPDTYRFEVMAVRGAGTNSIPAVLSLTVEPEFYETSSFRVAVAVGILLLVYGWYAVQRQRIRHVEDIRQRIARDLHDEVGANIGAITLLSGIAAEEQKGGSEGAEAVSEIREVAQKTAQVLREVVWFVNPEFDTMGDLVTHMETMARRMFPEQRVDFQSEVEVPQFKLDLEFRRSFFAIYKEAIHNIVKHAEAAEITIVVAAGKNRLRFRLIDDGKGFDLNLKGEGNGLKNMRARAKEMGGEMDIRSERGSGSSLSLDVQVR